MPRSQGAVPLRFFNFFAQSSPASPGQGAAKVLPRCPQRGPWRLRGDWRRVVGATRTAATVNRQQRSRSCSDHFRPFQTISDPLDSTRFQIGGTLDSLDSLDSRAGMLAKGTPSVGTAYSKSFDWRLGEAPLDENRLHLRKKSSLIRATK